LVWYLIIAIYIMIALICILINFCLMNNILAWLRIYYLLFYNVLILRIFSGESRIEFILFYLIRSNNTFRLSIISFI